ncbi:MAG: VWA domain-containing protein [Caldilineaceae bacterium]
MIRAAVDEMPEDSQAAIVVFGGDALVERLASPDPLFADLSSVPVTSRTNIGNAPCNSPRRSSPTLGRGASCLLSDGRENVGRAVEQAELAALNGIELSYMPLAGPEGEVEVMVERLDAPADVRQGQNFDLALAVNSTSTTDATLRIFADGSLIHSQSVRLQSGVNRFRVPFEDAQGGFVRFRAQVVPDNDTWLQNNEAGAFTVVHGEPRLLVVAAPEDGTNLAQALSAASMDVSSVAPADLPTTLAELAAYDGVILANVAAEALPAGSMDMLQVYVRDLGKGLLMTGGENSFGAGGYLRTPLEETLPVDMDVRSREQTPNLALALVVDKSGSMGSCHCENPDLEQTYERRPIGQPKVDIAKEAVMQAASALGPQDYLGVVAFDSSAHWAVDVNQVGGFAQIENAIGGIQAAGDTNIKAGGKRLPRPATSGRSPQAHHPPHRRLVAGRRTATLAVQMRGEGITLSVVAAGGSSALSTSWAWPNRAADATTPPPTSCACLISSSKRRCRPWDATSWKSRSTPSSRVRRPSSAWTWPSFPALGLQRHHAQRDGAGGADHTAG